MNAPLSDAFDKERLRRRRARSWALFAILAAFVAIVYAVTIVKIKLGYGP